MKHRSLVCIGITLLSAVANAVFRHKIEPFSFDIQKYEYPLEFNKFGTTVALKDTIKILPKVESRYGGLFMS